ncbi:MAG: UDP-N-acetylglucosamine--N-acetylmuramyl-(pentapeptide) pyrophosphoryl-undecaprenol N-acetylglucosamine transferase [Candidatus Marinimicrobia bacterium]|nr:UDP-N-acetylglucosamine--N-acetylmuramyl-(pentapeptide) pyrophosphoryl-undecaprenol N-acetylglucosamine transferase [Candidatus Neomarinimicrobiota bacterium]
MSAFAIACGGTGGHVLPGLAVAQVLRQRGHETTLWLTDRAIEADVARDWSGPRIHIPSDGFQYGASWKTVRAAWRLGGAVWASTRRMRDAPPAALLAMGSYACFGPALAARRLGVPLVLHEANVLPGRAVRLLARGAHTIAASFEESRYYLQGRPVVVTGMPLRPGLEAPDPGQRLPGLETARFIVLVMGGSGGAQALNRAACEALGALGSAGSGLGVIHLTGPADAAWVQAAYEQAGLPHFVRAFHADMAAVYRHAQLALCRAGAATCAELAAFGLPALLIPYPHASNDHQTANARALEKADAADVVLERDLTADWLREYVANRSAQPETLARMSAAGRKCAPQDAAARVADLLEAAACAG